MRTGDTVHHQPSGETWIVAYVDGEYMAWCGWPEGEARTEDCEVVRVVSDAEHEAWLLRIAESSGKRARMARVALARLAPGPHCRRCGARLDSLTGWYVVPGGAAVCGACRGSEERVIAQARSIEAVPARKEV